MLEFLTGAGLALSAGLNAYIPLLAIGLASRFLEFVQLPDAWLWLENDWLQTVVRPAAGGLAFGSGSTTET